jgi:hypothetical protein
MSIRPWPRSSEEGPMSIRKLFSTISGLAVLPMLVMLANAQMTDQAAREQARDVVRSELHSTVNFKANQFLSVQRDETLEQILAAVVARPPSWPEFIYRVSQEGEEFKEAIKASPAGHEIRENTVVHHIVMDGDPMHIVAISSADGSIYGGQERALRYDRWVLAEWSSWGGKAVLDKYGREYFTALRKRRTHYPKYKQKYSESPVIRPNRRVLAARENGRKGGIVRAAHYSPARLQAMARAGGIATRNRYGSEFYRRIRKLRKQYWKGYVTKKRKERLRQWAIREAEAEKNPGLAAIWLAQAKALGD